MKGSTFVRLGRIVLVGVLSFVLNPVDGLAAVRDETSPQLNPLFKEGKINRLWQSHVRVCPHPVLGLWGRAAAYVFL